MKDYESLIERLFDENSRVDTTDAQREANEFRIKQIRLMNRPIPPNTPYIRFDPITERLQDSNYSYAPSKLLSK
ncbi:hypothetical protein MKZ01_08480 [Lysinibacillus endophyticus]|uniref:hypothetical protein n=1 Tax=Ureibacillus endophyticus TaxID=1978490 RepID=UPI003134E83A